MITNCSHPTSALRRPVPKADVSPYAAATSILLRRLIEESDLAITASLHSRDLALHSQSTTALRIAL
jgi:hypothetical protein